MLEQRTSRLAEVMVRRASVITEQTRLSAVLALLQHGRTLTVVREGGPVGALSLHDLLELVVPGQAG